eukprot:192681-Alexandrium_andersonii.AAC.1
MSRSLGRNQLRSEEGLPLKLWRSEVPELGDVPLNPGACAGEQSIACNEVGAPGEDVGDDPHSPEVLKGEAREHREEAAQAEDVADGDGRLVAYDTPG